MEILGLFDCPIWLLGIVLFLFTICLYTLYKQSYFRRLGIPTKKTAFFFGDIPEIAKNGLGYVDIDMYKTYGKVFGTYMGNRPMLVVSDPAILKEITVKQFPKFTNRSGIMTMNEEWKSGISVAEGDRWRFIRHTLSPTFTSGKMRNMCTYIDSCLDTLLEVLEEKGQESPDGFDIAPPVHGYTMDVIARTGFGIDVNSQRNPDNPFITNAKEFLELKGVNNLMFILALCFPEIVKWFPKLMEYNLISKDVIDFFRVTTTQALAERRQSKSTYNDFLQLMMKAGETTDDLEIDTSKIGYKGQEKRALTDSEIMVNSILFMTAGYDTTAATICWLVYDLVTNPDVQERLIDVIDAEIGQENPTYDNVFKVKYLEMVVNETLRMHPPAPRINREASEDIEIHGLKIPKGMDCFYTASILHFMPEYWDEPHTYNPDRFAPENKQNINEYAYMPFGVGPRGCIGQRLALLEVKTTLVKLLQKYRLHKTDKLTIPMKRTVTGLIERPADPVMVKLEIRNK